MAGHRGLVGSAIVRRLEQAGLGDQIIMRSRSDLDLSEQDAVEDFFAEQRPTEVYLAAAVVGGIHANASRPVDFLATNLRIQTNVMTSAQRHGCRKLLFLGSSCIYPREAPQPMPESCLLGGPLEPTNQWYAIAKISGIKLAQALRRQHRFDAISLMPTNLYGPGDNFDLESSHVLPALMRKCHEAVANGDSEIEVWGSGRPRREFLHVDDLADACLFAMRNHSSEEILNVGTGRDVTIAQLAELIAKTVGFEGEFRYDRKRPDGPPRKLLDVSSMTALGWTAGIDLLDGLQRTYRWFRETIANGETIRT